MQQTRTHKTVPVHNQAQKLLSRRRQSDYSIINTTSLLYYDFVTHIHEGGCRAFDGGGGECPIPLLCGHCEWAIPEIRSTTPSVKDFWLKMTEFPDLNFCLLKLWTFSEAIPVKMRVKIFWDSLVFQRRCMFHFWKYTMHLDIYLCSCNQLCTLPIQYILSYHYQYNILGKIVGLFSTNPRIVIV